MPTAFNLAKIQCRCGRIQGTVTPATPNSVNRVVCYCEDCQTFAHALARPDILDAKGGSDVIQIAPATLTFRDGLPHIACMRLSERGLYRFYASCCGTPLGNTPGANIPLIGIPRAAFEGMGQDIDALFGPPRGAVHGEDAIGGAPAGSKGIPFAVLIRVIAKMIAWRLSGRARPHPYFDRSTQHPLFAIEVLPAERRDQLRAALKVARR